MAGPSRDLFQIGWICALPVEAAASKEMLDEIFPNLDDQDSEDSNAYTLGRINTHYVVIACLPSGQYGNNAATTVANNMIRTFSKSLKIGLMVGIGGGIPSADHDVRLGDIVVSCPQGTCGGVMQYDMGKLVLNGRLDRTGSLNSPPKSLLTALTNMRADEMREDPVYPQYIQATIKRTKRTQKTFGRPSTQQDRLFKAEYEHENADITTSCINCPAEWEVIRDERDDDDPQTHYGIIASGNAVVKHGKTRDLIGSEIGALCFEMEAAGLMMDFPCLVIRGICDYADSHKNKGWQGFAALAAASYAKQLLSYLPQGRVSKERLVVDVCDQLKKEVQKTNEILDRTFEQQEKHHKEKMTHVLTDQQQRCHQTFKISIHDEQKDINPRRADGTCQWAVTSPEYVRWQESRCNDLLWISADPGCGKSVLAKSIIDDYLEASISDPSVIICYFFFKDNDEQNRLSIALCAVIHQLISQRPDLVQHILPSWSKNGDSIRQEANELWRIFLAATSAESEVPCEVVCVFDALDECRDFDQGRLIEKLGLFYKQTLPSSQNKISLKFLVTSRPYDQIRDNFQLIEDSFPHIHLKGEEENHQIHKEIDLVVKIKVAELAKTARLSSTVQQKIERELLRMRHRTYLWLHLAIDDIKITFENSLLPEEESTQLIPSTVNTAYEKILSRVPSSQIEKAKRVLQIIVGARRPLTINEMALALGTALSPQSNTAAEAGLNPDHLGERLRRLCGLFVFINNSKIYLIHQTAREFLLIRSEDDASSENSIYAYSICETERQMADLCLRYLLMDDWAQERLKNSENPAFMDLEDFISDELYFSDDDIYREKEDQWLGMQETSFIQSFVNYAAMYWPGHVRSMASVTDWDLEMKELPWKIYDIKTESFPLWFRLLWRSLRPDELVPDISAIQLAAINGHEQMIQLLLAENGGQEIDAGLDDEQKPALVWASLYGHREAVELLLKHGADINCGDGLQNTALSAACSEGHEGIAKFLLTSGANITDGCLTGACTGGYRQIVHMLLEYGVDTNAGDGSALQYASNREGDDETIVSMLLKNGADVGKQGGFYGYALQAAASQGNGGIAEILLEHGADVNAEGGIHGTALNAACSQGHESLVEILLKNRANPNSLNGRALHSACSKGHEKIVQVLLKHGAEVNAEGGSTYGNTLNAACSEGHDSIVKILLDNGAYTKDGRGVPAACNAGHERIVRLLLESGTDVNAHDGLPLTLASDGGNENIVQMLLKYGAQSTRIDPSGNTAMTTEEERHASTAPILAENSVVTPELSAFQGLARKRRHS